MGDSHEPRRSAGRQLEVNTIPYDSEFYQIEVRDAIAKEWANARGEVDDMMAGLHEIRAHLAETTLCW